MIGNITKGSNVGGLLRYLLHLNKEAIVIGGNVGATLPSELEREFLTFSTLNQRVKRTVNHFSVGFASLDGVVDHDLKVLIANRIISEMGYENSQYLVVVHGRNDPGHDHIHDHDHIHIVANAVDLNGKWVDDFQSFRRFENILRQIEKDENLTQIEPSWAKKKRAPTHGQTQRYKRELREVAAGERATADLPVIDQLQIVIDTAARESKSVVKMAEKLAESGIETRLKVTRTGLARGISYSFEGVKFQGNQLHECSLPKLQSAKGLSFDPKTDPDRIGTIKVSEVVIDKSKVTTPNIEKSEVVIDRLKKNTPRSRSHEIA